MTSRPGTLGRRGEILTRTRNGTNDFVGKDMRLVIDMDAKLGKGFDQGLAKMKAVAEKGGATLRHNVGSG